MSAYLFGSLISLAPFDPSLLLTSVRLDVYLSCTFLVSSVVYVHTSAPYDETKAWPTYALVFYIFDAVWQIGHPSHFRLFLSLIYYVHSFFFYTSFHVVGTALWPYSRVYDESLLFLLFQQHLWLCSPIEWSSLQSSSFSVCESVTSVHSTLTHNSKV